MQKTIWSSKHQKTSLPGEVESCAEKSSVLGPAPPWHRPNETVKQRHRAFRSAISCCFSRRTHLEVHSLFLDSCSYSIHWCLKLLMISPAPAPLNLLASRCPKHRLSAIRLKLLWPSRIKRNHQWSIHKKILIISCNDSSPQPPTHPSPQSA